MTDKEMLREFKPEPVRGRARTQVHVFQLQDLCNNKSFGRRIIFGDVCEFELFLTSIIMTNLK